MIIGNSRDFFHYVMSLTSATRISTVLSLKSSGKKEPLPLYLFIHIDIAVVLNLGDTGSNHAQFATFHKASLALSVLTDLSSSISVPLALLIKEYLFDMGPCLICNRKICSLVCHHTNSKHRLGVEFR